MASENTSLEKRFRVVIDDATHDVVVRGRRVRAGDVEFEVTPGEGATMRVSDGARVQTTVVERSANGEATVWVDGHRIIVQVKDEKDMLLERYGLESREKHTHHDVRAPMPGLVVRVLVTEGESVERGQALVVLEAMKMENEIKADSDGVIQRVHVSAGDAVSKNGVLLEFES